MWVCICSNLDVCDREGEITMQEQDIDIDSESNFFDYVTSNCCYYTENQFKEKFNLEHGNVIAISESWLSHDKGTDFELEGYNFIFVNIANKKGG